MARVKMWRRGVVAVVEEEVVLVVLVVSALADGSLWRTITLRMSSAGLVREGR